MVQLVKVPINSQLCHASCLILHKALGQQHRLSSNVHVALLSRNLIQEEPDRKVSEDCKLHMFSRKAAFLWKRCGPIGTEGIEIWGPKETRIPVVNLLFPTNQKGHVGQVWRPCFCYLPAALVPVFIYIQESPRQDLLTFGNFLRNIPAP